MELAGVLLKRSAEAGEASEGAGAANSSAPNRSPAEDCPQIPSHYSQVSMHIADRQ